MHLFSSLSSHTYVCRYYKHTHTQHACMHTCEEMWRGRLWEGTTRRQCKKQKRGSPRNVPGRSQKLFGTTPRVEEAQQSGAVGMRPSERKTKQIFMSSPFPRRSQPRPSSKLAAHFGGGIRHYLEPLESTVKKVYFFSTPFSFSS